MVAEGMAVTGWRECSTRGVQEPDTIVLVCVANWAPCWHSLWERGQVPRLGAGDRPLGRATLPA
jgi:hypothetical protein